MMDVKLAGIEYYISWKSDVFHASMSWYGEMFSRSSVDESQFANAYHMNGSPPRHSEATEFASIFAPHPRLSSVPSLPPTLLRLFLILSMNLPGCRWWVEIRGLLKLNPCTSSCSPRAGQPVRPEATHQERLIAEKITLLNTLPGQCFFSPVATYSPVSPSASTNELPLDTDNTAEHLNQGQRKSELTTRSTSLREKSARPCIYVIPQQKNLLLWYILYDALEKLGQELEVRTRFLHDA